MLSRVADTLYWMARYMERTQAMLQVIRVHYQTSQDNPTDFSWRPVLYSYGNLAAPELAAIERDTPRVLERLLLDKNNPGSVLNNVLQARENARAVQDHITQEVWQCLNDFYHATRGGEAVLQIRQGDPLSGIDALMRNGLVYIGAVQNTMPRDESYGYLSMGKLLERAFQTADILRISWLGIAEKNQPDGEAAELRHLTQAVSGQELYLRTNRGNFNPESVLQFVLHNPHFTHSLTSCLNRLSWYFERLKTDSQPKSHQELEFMIGRLSSQVKYTRVAAARPEQLNAFLLEVRKALLDIAVALGKHFFGRSQ
ncbi:alpha-E domain-containing protein [Hymenobacter latericus]|uniref:alpha-E domain-containing protein n=1 Tax=Hymenobacter sp. YIM 151858-1 TaxID=2987688 RepID=UPI002226620D|nr:alpha-E domain-containing protein [Hymenobacter sp. YIM 151858-1]UYZ59674.1 alpha-E domain-containing protein [Hymenobacter sp. YIM 151858-1]